MIKEAGQCETWEPYKLVSGDSRHGGTPSKASEGAEGYLQGRITQKKKNATKKTRKGVNDECGTLEGDLRSRQQAEIDALQPSTVEDAAIRS